MEGEPLVEPLTDEQIKARVAGLLEAFLNFEPSGEPPPPVTYVCCHGTLYESERY